MDFQPDSSRLERQQQATEFAREQLNDNFDEREAQGEFLRENWLRCARFGIQGLPIPAKYGGAADPCDIRTAAMVMEGLGSGCDDLGLLFGLSAQIWTVQLPLLKFGTEEQRQRWLPPLCSGDLIAADAMTEPEAGSDVFSMQTTAERCDKGYRLNGSKCLVTFAPIADLALVFAMTAPDAGRWGMTAFIVERNTPGFSVSPVRSKMGLRTVPIGELTFENCIVPPENRIGDEGSGFAISQYSLEYERCCILASQIGAMQQQLDQSIEYSRSRVQFGNPIGKFQSVSNRIADMKLRLELARLLLYKVAWMKDNNQSAALEAAMLKLYLSESFVESSMDAVRIHGGHGYLSGSGVERTLRDSVGGLMYAGTSDIQRNIISGLMGL